MASEKRSQSANLKQAIFRLRVNLALRVRTAPQFIPSIMWKERCIGGRIVINPHHNDFPVMLSELLDVLSQSGWDIPKAVEQLNGTGSQLLKLLRHDPRALDRVNEERRNLDLRTLR